MDDTYMLAVSATLNPVDLSNSDELVRAALIDLVRPSGYVTWEYFSRQWLLARALLASSPRPLGRILDVGCGYGALSLSLAAGPTSEIVAMDILASRIDAVREKEAARDPSASGRVHLLVADAQRFPFRAETFDAIVATEVLEHLDDPTGLFREVRRILRPRGRFLMTTPNAGALPYRLLRFLPEGVVHKLAASCTQGPLHPELLNHPGDGEGARHPDHHRREGFTLPELRATAERADLRIVSAYTYRFPLPDRVMSITPRILSRSLANAGTHPLPLGLQVFAEFVRR